jgi:hypothetical protein
MLKDKVKVNEESNLEHHKWNKKLFNSPFFYQGIVEIDNLLNTLFGEYIILICVSKLSKEVVADFIFVVVDSGHIEELRSDGFLDLTLIPFFFLLNQLRFEVSHIKPQLALCDSR